MLQHGPELLVVPEKWLSAPSRAAEERYVYLLETSSRERSVLAVSSRIKPGKGPYARILT
jgi:hypothetical protein